MQSQSQNITLSPKTNAFRVKLWRALSIWLAFGILWVELWDLIQQKLSITYRLVVLFIGKLCFKVVWLLVQTYTLDETNYTWISCDKCSPCSVRGWLEHLVSWGLVFILLMTTHIPSAFLSWTHSYPESLEFFISLLFWMMFGSFPFIFKFILNSFFSSSWTKFSQEANFVLMHSWLGVLYFYMCVANVEAATKCHGFP